MQQAFRELESEINRSALNVEPVSTVSDEVYSVLKTRLFEKTPPDEEIVKIAEGYKEAVHEAKQMGYTNKFTGNRGKKLCTISSLLF